MRRLTRSPSRTADARLAAIEERLAQIERLLERQTIRTEQAPSRNAPSPPQRRVKARDPEFRRVAKRTVADGRTLLGPERLWVLWQSANNAASVGSLPVAEVGSYRGGSARFLAEAFRAALGKHVELHVIDTFTGHPEAALSDFDAPVHIPGLFGDTSVDEVRAYLAGEPGAHVHVGAIADVCPELPDVTYGFAHLDVDLYQPMLTALRFFGPRLPVGGVLVLDDYDARKCPGVRAAAELYLSETAARFHSLSPHTEQLVLSRVG
jgi:O-methyltransferase